MTEPDREEIAQLGYMLCGPDCHIALLTQLGVRPPGPLEFPPGPQVLVLKRPGEAPVWPEPQAGQPCAVCGIPLPYGP